MREIDERAYVAHVMQRFLKQLFAAATQAEVQRFVDFIFQFAETSQVLKRR